jgi:hypothetical protein
MERRNRRRATDVCSVSTKSYFPVVVTALVTARSEPWSAGTGGGPRMCAPSPPSHISRSLSPHLSQCRARLAVLLSARSVIHRGFTRACEARPAPTDLGTVSTSVHKRDGLQIRLPPVPSRPVIMKIVRNEQSRPDRSFRPRGRGIYVRKGHGNGIFRCHSEEHSQEECCRAGRNWLLW